MKNSPLSIGFTVSQSYKYQELQYISIPHLESFSNTQFRYIYISHVKDSLRDGSQRSHRIMGGSPPPRTRPYRPRHHPRSRLASLHIYTAQVTV